MDIEDLELTEKEIEIFQNRRNAARERKEAVYAVIADMPSSLTAIERETGMNRTYVKQAVKDLVTQERVFPLPGKAKLAGKGRPTTIYAATKVEKASVDVPGVSIRREPIWVCVNLTAECGAPCTRCNACGRFGKEVRT